MSILGPDGQPIRREEPQQPQQPRQPSVREIVQSAKEVAKQGTPEQGLQQMVFAFQQDVSSDLVVNATCELLEQVMQGRGENQSDELQLFENLRNHRNDPEAYYHIGSRFLQLGQYVIARPFLAHAKKLIGAEQNELSNTIDVEYSQALMELGAYQEAINVLQKLNDDYGGLPAELILKMTECYALLRQTEEADALFEVVTEEALRANESLEVWRDEVGDLLARVHDFDGEENLGLREWHYIQTRGIVLETNPDENFPGERFVLFTPSEEDIAYIISLSAAILDQKGYAPNRLLWLGQGAEPLARLFAEWWELEEENIRPYQQGDNTHEEDNLGLLVMAHSYDVFQLQNEEALYDLLEARAGLVTFALDLHWTERQPMVPDIAGFLSQVCYLPWEAKVEQSETQLTVTPIAPEDLPDPREVAKSLAAQFPSEEECDEFARETLEVYSGCTDLIIDHRDGDLIRKSLGTHSPLPSPRLGF